MIPIYIASVDMVNNVYKFKSFNKTTYILPIHCCMIAILLLD